MKRIDDCLVIEGGQRNYKELDFLKGFSIIAIVLRHLIGDYFGIEGTILRKVVLLGGAGIHVFFFCSGFGLYLSYLHRPVAFTDFIRRRFGKIYLPYIFIVVISFALPFIYQSPDRLGALFSHIFLYKMFMPEYIASFGRQMWYLSTVFQFYAVFIFLCKFKKRMNDKAFFVMSLTFSVLWWIFIICIGKSSERVWNAFFLQYLWEFSFGMVLANYLYKGNSIVISGKKIGIIALAGIGLYGIMGVTGGVFSSVNDIPGFFGFIAAALFVYMFTGEKLNNFFIKTASFSYELYLIHILIFEIVYAFLPNNLIVRSIFGCAAFGISYITAAFIRKLFNYLKNYKGGGWKRGKENVTQISEDKRDYLVSMLRVFATILVLLGHCTYPFAGWGFDVGISDTAVYITHYIYSFHMPLFMMLSGYVFELSIKNKKHISVSAYIKKRFRRLIIPLFFIKFFVWNPVNYIIDSYDIGYTFDNIVHHMFANIELGHLWYLFTLFFISVMAYIIKSKCFDLEYKKAQIIYSVIILFVFLLAIFSEKLPSGGKGIITGIYYYPLFFVIGIKIYKIQGFKNIIISKTAGFLLFVFHGVLWGFVEANVIQCSIFVKIILAATGSFMWFAFAYYLRAWIKFKIFIELEENSMVIYLFHLPVLYLLLGKFSWEVSPACIVFILFVIGLISSIFIGKILRRFHLSMIIGEK